MSVVSPEYIKAQREAGWPDMHPEDYCHRCGNRNPLWYADRDDWLTAIWRIAPFVAGGAA